MADTECQIILDCAKRYGANRVVVTKEGVAVPADVAKVKYKVQSDVLFVRNDGWVLGAPRQFEAVARRMWKDSWVAELQVEEIPKVEDVFVPATTDHPPS